MMAGVEHLAAGSVDGVPVQLSHRLQDDMVGADVPSLAQAVQQFGRGFGHRLPANVDGLELEAGEAKSHFLRPSGRLGQAGPLPVRAPKVQERAR